MSRNTIIWLVVLCVGVAGLIGFSKWRSAQHHQATPPATGTQAPVTSGAEPSPRLPGGEVVVAPPANQTPTAVPPRVATQMTLPRVTNLTRNADIATAPGVTIVSPLENEPPIFRPLPELEKEYRSATNRDVRLDLMMDIAENPSADAVRTLTRLFEAETDPDLKVDLLDSLLGIEGFKDEKLIMLTLGVRQGLPNDVRQSAIDGLIDLEDPRVIPILNGLLNDSDPEIREGAQDALEMIQAQPVLKPK